MSMHAMETSAEIKGTWQGRLSGTVSKGIWRELACAIPMRMLRIDTTPLTFFKTLVHYKILTLHRHHWSLRIKGQTA